MNECESLYQNNWQFFESLYVGTTEDYCHVQSIAFTAKFTINKTNEKKLHS